MYSPSLKIVANNKSRLTNKLINRNKLPGLLKNNPYIKSLALKKNKLKHVYSIKVMDRGHKDIKLNQNTSAHML